MKKKITVMGPTGPETRNNCSRRPVANYQIRTVLPLFGPEDRGNMFVQKFGKHLPDYTASRRRR
jgi:hypothetical protein